MGGSFAFVGLLNSALSGGVAVTAEQDAENVASQLENSTQSRLPDVDDDEQVMQLLDNRGAVVDATEEAEDVNLPSPSDDGAVSAIRGEATRLASAALIALSPSACSRPAGIAPSNRDSIASAAVASPSVT